MFAYVARRLLISIVVLFFATIFVFLLVASSGDPLALLKSNPHIPHSTIVAREKLLHLNHPLWDRYWIWLTARAAREPRNDDQRPGRGVSRRCHTSS